jgi:hypothetical protein
MAGVSKSTKVVGVRLPNEVVETIRRRCMRNLHYITVGTYLRNRIVYDITRKHGSNSKDKKQRASERFDENADTSLAHK